MSYRGADKSLARQGMKKANVSVRMAWISFGALPCTKKKIDNSSRLDVVEVARFAWHASELVSFLVGLRTYQHPGVYSHSLFTCFTVIWEWKAVTSLFRVHFIFFFFNTEKMFCPSCKIL